MIDPTLYTKNPSTHAIKRMTAMAYNKLPIVFVNLVHPVKWHFRAMRDYRYPGIEHARPWAWNDGLIPHNCRVNSPTFVEISREAAQGVDGMIFTPFRVNKFYMNISLHLISTVLGTYFCSVGFVVVLFKLFFPLKTKEEIERLEMEKELYMQRLAKRQSRVNRNHISLPALKRSEQLA
jgi:hypothetical protein